MQLSEQEIKLLENMDTSSELLYTIYKYYEYENDKDPDDVVITPERKLKALVFLKESCKRQHGKALFTLSVKCFKGDIGVKQNLLISGKLLEASAKAGFYKAAFVLSNKYKDGVIEEGFEQNAEKANHWLRIAAGYKKDGISIFYKENGYPIAQRIVGLKHLYGDVGFKKCKNIYVKLMVSASRNGCNNGDHIAQEELFFLVMKSEKRKNLERFLPDSKIRQLRRYLVRNMPSHNPIFGKSPFARTLVNEYMNKQRKRQQVQRKSQPLVIS